MRQYSWPGPGWPLGAVGRATLGVDHLDIDGFCRS